MKLSIKINDRYLEKLKLYQPTERYKELMKTNTFFVVRYNPFLYRLPSGIFQQKYLSIDMDYALGLMTKMDLDSGYIEVHPIPNDNCDFKLNENNAGRLIARPRIVSKKDVTDNKFKPYELITFEIMNAEETDNWNLYH